MEQSTTFIQKLKTITNHTFEKTGRKPRVFLETYGCQMNTHDSEKLAGMLQSVGYETTATTADADMIIYNTCCVRENAENKVYGHVGALKNLKKDNPHLKIVLCGCMMQQKKVVETIMKTHRHVDVIFGTHNIHRLPELLVQNFETKKMAIDIWDKHGALVEDLPVARTHPFKANVTIMFGCDNFCSYCIVPYVRGREMSRLPETIVDEIKTLAAGGTKEVTLLGQNVNSYGAGLEVPTDFATLLREINQIEGLARIRFMTSHPKDLSDALILAMAECNKVCHCLHLPIQSGSDRILAQMNRQYTRAGYLALLARLRYKIPHISVTTDIIVGFPGETEEDFQDTLSLLSEAAFSGAFTFIYSIRSGTPAATMDNQVPEDVVKDRFNRLMAVSKPLTLIMNQKRIGTTHLVLVDEVNADNTVVTGRSEDNSIVHFPGNRSMIGDIFAVQITSCKTFYLVGECVY